MNLDTHPRLVNLAAGHALRIERARLLKAVRGREADPIALALEPPQCLKAMLTFDFLLQVPGVGRSVLRQLNACAIRDHVNLAVTLGELTEIRRHWIARRLRDLAEQQAARPLASRPQG